MLEYLKSIKSLALAILISLVFVGGVAFAMYGGNAMLHSSGGVMVGDIMVSQNSTALEAPDFHADGDGAVAGHVKFKQGTTPSVHKEADHSILWVDSSGKLYLEQPDGTDIEITHQSGLDITEIYNSAGMLKIQPDVQGNVELFGDTDVGNSENGKMFYVRRQAPEGNDYIRMYVSSSRNSYIHSDRNLTLQGQVDFTINSVTDDIIFKVGDNAGAKKFYFKDSDGTEVANIDSDGDSYFAGNMGIGIAEPAAYLDVIGNATTSGKSLQLRSGDGFNQTDSSQIIFSYDGRSYESSGYGHSIRTRHRGSSGPGNAIDFWLWNYDVDDVSTLGSTRVMTIDGTGNVGIGAETPQLPLEVRNTDDNLAIFVDDRAQAQGVGGGIAFGGKYTDAGAEAMAGRIGTQKTNGTSGDVGFDMVFQTQNSVGTITDRLFLGSDGKVGIGNTNPSTQLDLTGNAYISDNLTINGYISPLTFTSSTGIKLDLYGNDTYAIGVESSELRIASNGKITFGTDGYTGYDDVVITDDGYVGIGIDNPHDDFHIASETPSFVFEETDANNSEKVWEWMAVNGKLSLKTQSDLYTASQTVMSIDRGGTSPTVIDFPNSTMVLGDLAGSYGGGSAYVCVYNSGELFASNSACP